MAQCTTCNLCEKPGTFERAQEIAIVPCHVRRFKDNLFTVWRCTNCGSLHSKEDADLALYYKHYPFQNHKLDFHARIGYRNRLRLLKRRGIRKESLILDYGCGAGLFVDFLKEEGFTNVRGYDAFVEKYSDVSVLSDKYDVVVSHDVIEHVDDPRDYLRTLVSLLKIQGVLVIGTPNADRISLKPQRHFPVELSQPYHRHILSERMLKILAAEFGLDIEHTYRRFYFDSLYPGVNTRFMWTYVNTLGGFIDACVEPPRIDIIRSSPKLLFYAFFGYFFPPRGNILLSMRKILDVSIRKVANE